jgi:hypothetical protein
VRRNGAFIALEPPVTIAHEYAFYRGASVTGIDDSGQVFGTFVFATPLPAALPLFATGLGAIGLLA